MRAPGSPFAVAVIIAGLLLGSCGNDSSHAARGALTSLPKASAGSRPRFPAPAKPDDSTPKTLTLYYLGAGPRGPVLHKTSMIAPPEGGALDLAMESLMARADDPALRTWWKPGWLVAVSHAHGAIEVDASGAPAGLPRSMTPLAATASLQQAVYTLQAVTHSHDPVRFTHGGQPATSVLGVPTTHPVRARPFAQVMSLMNVQAPSWDETVFGRRPYTILGTANTAGGSVSVRVERDGRVIRSGTAHTRGSGSLDRVYPWHVDVDIRGLAKGVYQVIASGPDPTQPSLTVTDTGRLRLH